MVRGHLTLLAPAAAGCATTANAAGSGRHHRPLNPTAIEMPAKMTTHEIMMPEPGKRDVPVRPNVDDNNRMTSPPQRPPLG